MAVETSTVKNSLSVIGLDIYGLEFIQGLKKNKAPQLN
jgi:hypothetical protein